MCFHKGVIIQNTDCSSVGEQILFYDFLKFELAIKIKLFLHSGEQLAHSQIK